MRRRDNRRVPEARGQRLRVLAPQDRDEGRARPVRAPTSHQRVDRALCDLLPAAPPMRGGGSRAHGQHAVEQAHALLAPWRQIARRRGRASHVLAELPEDVDQGLRDLDPRTNRKRQAHRVTRRRVWVLSHDQYLHRIEGVRERAQHVRPRGQVAAPLVHLGGQHRAQLVDAALDRRQSRGPSRIDQLGQRTRIVIAHDTSLMPRMPPHTSRVPHEPRPVFSDSLNA